MVPLVPLSFSAKRLQRMGESQRAAVEQCRRVIQALQRTAAGSSEAAQQLETVLAGTYRGVIQKTWLGPAIGSNTGPCVAVALVARQ